MKKLLILSLMVAGVGSATAATLQKTPGRYLTDPEYKKEAQSFAQRHGFSIPEVAIIEGEAVVIEAPASEKPMRVLPVQESGVGYQAPRPQEGVVGYEATTAQKGVVGYQATEVKELPTATVTGIQVDEEESEENFE